MIGRRALVACVVLGLALVSPARAPAEQQNEALVAIVHPRNPITEIGKTDLRNIYLGHQLTWPDGTAIRAFMRPESSTAGHAFFRDVLKMTPARFRHHWQELELSGQGTAPKTLSSSKDVAEKVSGSRGTISYAIESDAKDLGGDVKVIRISE
jgi:hypothetical protein